MQLRIVIIVRILSDFYCLMNVNRTMVVGFKAVYLKKKMSEMFHKFQEYEKLVSTWTNKRINKNRCDQGEEYRVIFF